jgi:hypothetical protein
VEDGQSFHLKDSDPADSGATHSREHAAADLDKGSERLRDLQTKLAALRQWALLIVLQGLDAGRQRRRDQARDVRLRPARLPGLRG